MHTGHLLKRALGDNTCERWGKQNWVRWMNEWRCSATSLKQSCRNVRARIAFQIDPILAQGGRTLYSRIGPVIRWRLLEYSMWPWPRCLSSANDTSGLSWNLSVANTPSSWSNEHFSPKMESGQHTMVSVIVV